MGPCAGTNTNTNTHIPTFAFWTYVQGLVLMLYTPPNVYEW